MPSIDLFARSVNELQTKNDLGNDLLLFSDVIVPVGNMPDGYKDIEALQLSQIALIIKTINGSDSGGGTVDPDFPTISCASALSYLKIMEDLQYFDTDGVTPIYWDIEIDGTRLNVQANAVDGTIKYMEENDLSAYGILLDNSDGLIVRTIAGATAYKRVRFIADKAFTNTMTFSNNPTVFLDVATNSVNVCLAPIEAISCTGSVKYAELAGDSDYQNIATITQVEVDGIRYALADVPVEFVTVEQIRRKEYLDTTFTEFNYKYLIRVTNNTVANKRVRLIKYQEVTFENTEAYINTNPTQFTDSEGNTSICLAPKNVVEVPKLVDYDKTRMLLWGRSNESTVNMQVFDSSGVEVTTLNASTTPVDDLFFFDLSAFEALGYELNFTAQDADGNVSDVYTKTLNLSTTDEHFNLIDYLIMVENGVIVDKSSNNNTLNISGVGIDSGKMIFTKAARSQIGIFKDYAVNANDSTLEHIFEMSDTDWNLPFSRLFGVSGNGGWGLCRVASGVITLYIMQYSDPKLTSGVVSSLKAGKNHLCHMIKAQTHYLFLNGVLLASMYMGEYPMTKTSHFGAKEDIEGFNGQVTAIRRTALARYDVNGFTPPTSFPTSGA